MPIDNKALTSITLYPYYEAELSSSQLSNLQYTWFKGESGILFGFNVLNTGLSPIMQLQEYIYTSINTYNLPWVVVPNDCFIFVNGKKLIKDIDFIFTNSNKTLNFTIPLNEGDFLCIFNIAVSTYLKYTVANNGINVQFNVGSLNNNILIFRNGILQRNTDDYTYSSPNLTILGSVSKDEIIEVYTTTSNLPTTNIILNNNQTSITLGYTPTNPNNVYSYLNGVFLNKNMYTINSNTFLLTDPTLTIKNTDVFFTIHDTASYASISNNIFTVSDGVLIKNNIVIYLDHQIELIAPIIGEYYILFKYIDTQDFPNSIPEIGVYTLSEYDSSPSDYVKLAKINNGVVEYIYTNQREVKRYTLVGEYNSDSNIKPILDRELAQGNYMVYIESRNSLNWDDTVNIAKLKIYDGSDWKDIIDFSNAQFLDGMHARTTDEANSIAARDNNADLTTRKYISTAKTIDSVPPLEVNSTIKVNKLNVDYFDNKDSRFYASQDHIHSDLHHTADFSIRNLRWCDFVMVHKDLSNFAGYICGGQNTSGGTYTNTIIRLRTSYYATNVNISSHVTTLGTNRSRSIGVNSNANGYIIGGGNTTVIDKLVFDRESTSTISISLDNFGFHSSRLNSNSCGYIFGGENSSYSTLTNRIYSLNFNDDSFNILMNYLGISINLPTNLSRSVGMGKHTHGYILTGNTSTTLFLSGKVEKFLYQIESIHELSISLITKKYATSVYTSKEGYIIAGQDNTNSVTNTIQKFDYLSETVSTLSETLGNALYGSTGINSQSVGFICGGLDSSNTAVNTVYGLRFNPIASTVDSQNSPILDSTLVLLNVTLPSTKVFASGIQNLGTL